MTLDEFKKEYPDIARALIDEGYDKGFKAASNVYGKKPDQEQEIKKNFLTQVDEYLTLHKCSKTEAMQRVIQKDPAAHQQYIRAAQKR